MSVTSSAPWSRERLQSLQQASIPLQHCWSRVFAENQLSHFLERGFPTRRHESWKYTATDPIAAQEFNLPAVCAITDKIDLSDYQISAAIRLVFVNGRFIADLSDLSQLPMSVLAINLANAWEHYPEHCQAFYASAASAGTTVFSVLNAALITDGLYLQIPANMRVDRPIHLLHFNTLAAHQTMQHTRHLVQVGENSHVHLLEEYVGAESSVYLQNVVTQINLAANAELFHYKLQREAATAFHLAHIDVTQQRDSRAYFAYVAGGARLSRDDIYVGLQHSGTFCQLNGLYLPQSQQHIANYSWIDHVAPHTTSEQNYRGIIQGQGNGVFNGKVKVHPYAVQSHAEQANHNLLLSPQSVINTKPELEIYADDVRCSHGATVGQLDPQSLFYLQSRGVAADDAQRLLISGFAEQALVGMRQNVVVDYLRKYVEKKVST